MPTYMPNPSVQKYDYEQRAHVVAHLTGLASFKFTYDGGKMRVWHDGPTLVYAEPTAKGGDPWSRVTLFITPQAGTYKGEVIGGQNYSRTPYGNRKHQAALTMLVECWKANPTPDHLYQVVGHKSGHCAICGRVLTVPESMNRGIGPECITSIYGPALQKLYIKAMAQEV